MSSLALRLRATATAVVAVVSLAVMTGCAATGPLATSSSPENASTSAPTPSPLSTVSVESLLAAAESTVLDQPLVYPSAVPAQVSSSIVTLPAGAQTGWHFHSAPLYAYILEGQLTVTYDTDEGQVEKTYSVGQSVMEALETPHNGQNRGAVDVKILVVNLGASGVMNTTPLP